MATIEEAVIGSEIEIYKTPSAYMMIDLNPGKVGGAKRFGSFACLDQDASHLESKVSAIAQSYSWDVRSDCYIVFDLSLGVQEVDGRTYLSPFVYHLKRTIEERGYIVKGLIGREKIFSESPENWKKVTLGNHQEIKNIEYDIAILEDLAATQSVYLGCHFAPRSCTTNYWDNDTCRNGFINNFLDLPSINWLFMRECEFSPYKDAFVFSRKTDLNVKDELVSLARGNEELREKCEEMKRRGHLYAAIKDLSKMSIGGRGVSFIDLNELDGLVAVPSTALVMPYFQVEPTQIDGARVVLQTRMVYSSVRSPAPDFIFAKVYSENNVNTRPMNLSSMCTDFIVWDLRDGMYHIHSLSKGKSAIRKSTEREKADYRMFFEPMIAEVFPEIKKVEQKLLDVGIDSTTLFRFYKKMKKQQFVPGAIYPFLNLFQGLSIISESIAKEVK
ncbi:hypothetical protein HYX12_00780 [Candidatus Woesearchaeota archaeon]|nr:hypothetical protein [Candidatus Woesearchaeota archaeon]